MKEHRKILVIDDEPDLLTLAQMGLELRDGWEVQTAWSPVEGLRQAAEWRPDAILLDLTFPDVDGFEVLARLRAQAATQDIPVLLVSGKLAPGAAREHGVAGVVEKPFDVTTLADDVAACLGWS